MAVRVTFTSVTYDLTRCWECNKIHSQVVYLNCDHSFCLSHLDDQLTEQTEGSRQPCRACFKLTVPATRAELRALTSALPPAAAGLSLEKGNYQCSQHSHNAIFHWNFQKHSVKILYAIID